MGANLRDREVLKDDDGTLRCAFTLELLGYWFKVGDTNYYMTKENNSKL